MILYLMILYLTNLFVVMACSFRIKKHPQKNRSLIISKRPFYQNM